MEKKMRICGIIFIMFFAASAETPVSNDTQLIALAAKEPWIAINENRQFLLDLEITLCERSRDGCKGERLFSKPFSKESFLLNQEAIWFFLMGDVSYALGYETSGFIQNKLVFALFDERQLKLRGDDNLNCGFHQRSLLS